MVNARHVKAVPGRKTDIAGAQWLAVLGRAGLVQGPFSPPVELRHQRLIAWQRQQRAGMRASEKNRLHKILTDAGTRLNVLVADLHGQPGRPMVKAIVADENPAEILKHSGRLKASRQERLEALPTEEI